MIKSVQERIARNAEAIFTPEETKGLYGPAAMHEYMAETEAGTVIATRTQHRMGRDGSGGGFKIVEAAPGMTLKEMRQQSRAQALGLATLMTLKGDLLDLHGMLPGGVGEDFGGAKGVMYVPAGSLASRRVMDPILRDYVVVQAGKGVLGPGIDRHAPDMNTGPIDMAVMARALADLTGDEHAIAAFSGKPPEYGGVEGRDIATGQGLVFTLANHLGALGHDPHETTVAVQGSGNVGYHFARLAMQQLGVKIVGMSDRNRAIVTDARHPLRIDETIRFKDRLISGWDDERHEHLDDPDDMLGIDADVFMFGAMPNVVTQEKRNMEQVKARTLLLGGNNPLDSAAIDYYLADGRSVVADVMGNAGGFMVSNVEYNQGMTKESWVEVLVIKALQRAMDDAYGRVLAEAGGNPLNMVDPAFRVALKRRYERDHGGSVQ